ncbi:MAG: hypothetical protein J5911_05200 [Clostridia bacterium]|nr:hypothetical protein [Clostridia bacterium]
MINKKTNFFIILSAAVFIICLFAALCVGVREVDATTDVNYKKKIVSVLFDNSDSMSTPVNDNKTEFAKYSLEMLTTLLSEQDELYIWPMNARSGNTTSAFKIELANDVKMAEIEQKIINNSALKPTGSTPPASVDKALSTLREKGLKSSSDKTNDDNGNVEYWLVILTDGEFNGTLKSDEVLRKYIKNYVGLNTIYLAFGSYAADITGSDINTEYPISTYCVRDVQGIISAMQDVSNKISGRYGAETNSDKYVVSDNKIIVDLDKFSFSVNNVAVVVQDSGAKLVSAIYGGQNLTITQSSVLKGSFPNTVSGQPNIVELLQDGYTAVVKAGEYMSSGQIVFTFDKPVGDNVSVLVEPAIFIDAYLEKETSDGWVRTDMQEINGNMRPGDKIRVQYKVYESSNNSELSIGEIFGTPTEKITYCGKGFAVGAPIPLEVGKNAISVMVSVLDGHFTMYSSIICYIDDTPNFYRIEGVIRQGEGNDVKKSDAIYTVYENNIKRNKNELSNYNIEVFVKHLNGSLSSLPYEIGADGNIVAHFDGEGLAYGEYFIIAKVTNKETNLMRTNEQIVLVSPAVVKAQCLNSENLRISSYILGNDKYDVEFALELDGKEAAFDDASVKKLIRYNVKVGNTDVTEKCSTKDGKLVFAISANNLPELSAGKKRLELSVSSIRNIRDTVVYEFEILDSVYTVRNIALGTNKLDLYHLRDTEAAVYFKLYRDGVLISAEEIETAITDGEISFDTQSFGWIDLLPCRVDTFTEIVDGEAVVVCKMCDDMAEPWDSLSSLVSGVYKKEITLNYNDASAIGVIEINNLSFVDRLLRWLIIILIIALIIHIITYILGFKIAKPLPRGVMLKFSTSNLDTDLDVDSEELNKRSDIVKWHLLRFIIPCIELAGQRPKIFFPRKRPKILCDCVEWRINKKTKTAKFVALKDMVEMKYTPKNNKDGNALQEMIAGCEENEKIITADITTRSFMNFFSRRNNAVINEGDEDKIGIDGWYGILEEKQDGKTRNVTDIVTIIKYSKQFWPNR